MFGNKAWQIGIWLVMSRNCQHCLGLFPLRHQCLKHIKVRTSKMNLKMKIKVIPAIIVVVFSALIAYGLYYLCTCDKNYLVLIGFGVMSMCILLATFGVSFEPHRTSVNIKVTSIVFFLLALISNVVFALVPFSVPLYVVVNGIVLLVWLLSVYGISKARQ